MDFKKAGYKLLTYLPIVGLVAYSIKERKTRKGKPFPYYDLRKKEDLKAIGIYALEIGYSVFAIGWKVYLGNGIATGEWNPLNYFKSEKDLKRTEKVIEKKSLEKTLNYNDFLKQNAK